MVVSAVPDEVVDAKISVEQHPVAGRNLEAVRDH